MIWDADGALKTLYAATQLGKLLLVSGFEKCDLNIPGGEAKGTLPASGSIEASRVQNPEPSVSIQQEGFKFQILRDVPYRYYEPCCCRACSNALPRMSWRIGICNVYS